MPQHTHKRVIKKNKWALYQLLHSVYHITLKLQKGNIKLHSKEGGNESLHDRAQWVTAYKHILKVI